LQGGVAALVARQIHERRRLAGQQQRRSLAFGGLVELTECLVVQGQRLFEAPRGVRGAGGKGERLHDVDPTALGGVRYPGPELERSLEMAQRLRRRIRGRQSRRLDAGHQGGRSIVRRIPVNRERGRGCRG
jgi:hypothetical protein